MKVEQRMWTEAPGSGPLLSQTACESAQLVFVFGATARLRQADLLEPIRKLYPKAHIFGCSTAGEICGTRVSESSLVTTAVHFDHTQILTADVAATSTATSFQAGETLGGALPPAIYASDHEHLESLVHVLVLSEGLHVNGSELVRGLASRLPKGVTITGGLAGDGARFGETLVFRNAVAMTDVVAAVGLYGSHLKVGFGSMGGWDVFGPERLVTRSQGNVLLELDGRPALALYEQYLGEHAAGLPATGLLFPLSVRMNANDPAVVRTILAVDQEKQSMTFAGDVPEGAYARLAKANFDRLIEGAAQAARCSASASTTPSLAILISCVGRRLVLKQRIEEEVEAVRDVLGQQAILTGFYSYGEIAPFVSGARCELHNQTMTVTTLTEV